MGCVCKTDNCHVQLKNNTIARTHQYLQAIQLKNSGGQEKLTRCTNATGKPARHGRQHLATTHSYNEKQTKRGTRWYYKLPGHLPTFRPR